MIRNERFKKIYEEEQRKLSSSKDADKDFIALDNAWNRWEKEKGNG